MSSIKLISQSFFKELSTASVSWLLANVGDKIRIETTFGVQAFCVGSSKNQFTLNAVDGYVGVGWLKGFRDCFKDFKIGDTIVYYDQATETSADFTIIDKISNFEIQLNTVFTLTAVNSLKGDCIFSLKTAITAVKYSYNFIENNTADTFISAIDGSEQMLVIRNKAATSIGVDAMEFIGALDYQFGNATIQGISAGLIDGVWTSKYKVIHYTKVTPFILYDQINNQESGISPLFFKDKKCWKFITKIEAANSYTNPNFSVQTTFSNVLGNSGWFNENYNTEKTNYSISGLSFTNVTAIDSIQLDLTETTITFDVENTTDTPFSNNNTKFILGFQKVPADPAEYQNTGKTADQNFCYDRALQTVGSAAVNGDNYGGSYQVLKGISAAFVSTSKITVTAKVLMSATVLASFNASSEANYQLFLTIQNHTLDTTSILNDLVTLEVDLNTFVVITTDATMIVVDRHVTLRHPEFDYVNEGLNILDETVDPPSIEWFIPSLPEIPYSIGCINNTLGINHAIGCGLWISDLNTMMLAMVNSINTHTSSCPFTQYNDGDFIASWNNLTKIFSLSVPIGSGTQFHNNFFRLYANNGSLSGDSALLKPFISPKNILEVFPQDELVSCSDFYIESETRTTDVIKITSINPKIIVSNGTDEFELESYLINTENSPLIGYTQQFDLKVEREFHIPENEIRKYFEVKRRNDLDTGTRKYFSAFYPFLIRWETWAAALGIDASFFDSTLPNNGFNHWWFHYKAGTWKIYYKLEINATKNGTIQQYFSEQEININDYSSNSDFTTKSTCTFKEEDLTALLSGSGGAVQLITGGGGSVTINGQNYLTTGENFVFNYKKTLIVAIFTKSSLPTNVNVEIDVEVFEQGGISGKRRYSSKWEADSDTWFSSVDGSGKVKLYAYGNSIVALCYIDPETLNFPSKTASWSFSPRIFELATKSFLLQESGDFLLQENNSKIIL